VAKVGEIDGIEIKIKSSEHGNPHIHAWYQGKTVKIFIRTLDVESGGLPPKEMRKLRKWIRDHENDLLELWDAVANSP